MNTGRKKGGFKGPRVSNLKKTLYLLVIPAFIILAGCSEKQVKLNLEGRPALGHQAAGESTSVLLVERYKAVQPRQWGERVDGVKRQLDTEDKVIALTFDACGGKYDSGLIDYLIKENVKATLFINSRWIDANEVAFLTLSRSPLFEIENHGSRHLPLSVNGKTAYGIRGTASIAEVIKEIRQNEQKIERLTGRKPRFFRSGTAYYDEVAVRVANDLEEEVVNFDVLGDAGATYTREEVKKACLRASPGSIVILHMNHPEKDTAAGVQMAVPELKKRGYSFVKLEEYPLK